MKLRWDNEQDMIICSNCGAGFKSIIYQFKTIGDLDTWSGRKEGMYLDVEVRDTSDGALVCKCGAQFEGIKGDWNNGLLRIIVPWDIMWS